MKRTFAALLSAGVLVACAAAHAQVKGESGGVYIAGDAFTLDQALADAARDGAGRYIVLVLGAESRRLVIKGTPAGELEKLRQAQRAGATFAVCERDLAAAGLTRRELLPGVQVARGWTAEELRSEKPGASLPPGRRITRLCS